MNWDYAIPGKVKDEIIQKSNKGKKRILVTFWIDFCIIIKNKKFTAQTWLFILTLDKSPQKRKARLKKKKKKKK